ncbi:hypothetical protein WICANDRAFT_98143 [Wickerhamomyces anomalus NRRL Y-366-8]|uniref:Uncharacterized protein n=1 Tax=Wickerhamomyces anomalus (strain ATCC 58044 / CBS 1984 / NCYC 433 / NRRL Y-366-8) TaxID=683960 RepID=A0A1E3NUT6_WICAA|nr:uncharacterized protein WICANDRAFT_98143 [Wickerhamomyces anomalus NRRL Y-366-8]ODQ56898.1 hypothetical protein WICANDRAFT_98143 [Wickerhamomyces anomalus NRRL Y-366-8]
MGDFVTTILLKDRLIRLDSGRHGKIILINGYSSNSKSQFTQLVEDFQITLCAGCS